MWAPSDLARISALVHEIESYRWQWIRAYGTEPIFLELPRGYAYAFVYSLVNLASFHDPHVAVYYANQLMCAFDSMRATSRTTSEYARFYHLGVCYFNALNSLARSVEESARIYI